MKKYRVVVEETQSYEVYVEAPNDIEAERIALENYGYDGEIFNTDTNAVVVKEDVEREKMWVCKKCLMAIESREGNQAILPHFVDEEDSKCDWCEETGFDVLYELV